MKKAEKKTETQKKEGSLYAMAAPRTLAVFRSTVSQSSLQEEEEGRRRRRRRRRRKNG
jgi:hypothetical protein